MNKLFTKIATAMVGIAMAVGVGVAVGSKSGSGAREARADTTYKLTINGSDFKNSGYSANDGDHTFTAQRQSGTGSATISVTVTTKNVMQGTGGNAGKMQFQNNNQAILYNKTDLGTVTAVTITSGSNLSYTIGSTQQPSTSGSGGYFKVVRSGGTGYCTKIEVSFTIGESTKTLSSITSSGETTLFETPCKFSYGGTLTAHYEDAADSEVNPTSFKIGNAGIDPKTSGTAITTNTDMDVASHNGKTVYVLYTEGNTTVYASYVITVKVSSTISFVSDVDKGSSSGQNPDTLSKGVITIEFSSAYTSSGAYRIYSGSDTTISTSNGKISRIVFAMNGSYNSNIISIKGGTPGSYSSSDSSSGIWTGDASAITFTTSAQARCNSITVTLASTEPSVEITSSESTKTINPLLKGDINQLVKVKVNNIETKVWTFTFDEDGVNGKNLSSHISVSQGSPTDDIYTLTITGTAKHTSGNTVIHISVSGTSCPDVITVTVAAKPASMSVTKGGNVITALELQNGSTKQQIGWTGLDTDGQPYSINAAAVSHEILSGSSYISTSSGAGTEITPVAVGTAVVRYKLKVLESVYADLTVNVINDYLVSFDSATFNTGLTATQGDSPTLAVFATRVGNTHFGTTADIPLDYFRFSYDDEVGATSDQFAYDFSHGTTFDATHKDQTIYVYCTLGGNNKAGEYSVRVQQANIPLVSIAIAGEGISNHAVNVERNGSLATSITYNPSNTTDNRDVVYSIDDSASSENHGITVNPSGVISVGDAIGKHAKIVATVDRDGDQSTTDDRVTDYVVVTIVLEEMTYVVNEPESWNATAVSDLSTGDVVVIVGNNGSNYALPNNNGSSSAPSATAVTVADGKLSGTVSSTIQWVITKTGDNLLFNIADTANYLYDENDNNGVRVGSDYAANENVFTIDSNYLFNVGQSRYIGIYNSSNWRSYTSINNNIKNQTFTFFKKSGGNKNYTVDSTLFNGVHNNFGAGKTYAWSDSCASFNSSAWQSACSALMGITGYANYKLNRAVANASGNEIEVFLAKYDFIISKTSLHAVDYLGRFEEGGIHYGERSVGPSTNSIAESLSENTSVILIAVISTIGIVSIGGYFFLRRRKEQ